MEPKKKKMIFLAFSLLILFLIFYFFIGKPPEKEEVVFGVNFSQKHSQNLGLDWRENYLALFNELGVKNLKLISHWDMIEREKDNFDFTDLDWQIEEAEKKNVDIILVIGMKTGRWPECHIPDWAKDLNKQELQERVIKLIETVVKRYQNKPSISYWEVENEALFPFGECPWRDKNFLKKEIELVRKIDPNRKILFADSGEGSLWITAAQTGDIVGITMYKKVWFKELSRYVSYPFPPVFYWRKALLIEKLFNKEVIVVELQAEPWGPKLIYDISLQEQQKTMNLDQLKYNVSFAKKTGLGKFYLWGSEWWYWLKEKQASPEIWEEVKKIF